MTEPNGTTLRPETVDMLAQALQKVIAVQDGGVVVIDPEPGGDEDTERVEFLRTGWVIFRDGDARWALRRPKVGEMKALDVHLEAIQDEATSHQAALASRQIAVAGQVEAIRAKRTQLAEAIRSNAVGSSASDAAVAELETLLTDEAAITLEVRSMSRTHGDAMHRLRVEFYEHAFKLLNQSKDRVPEGFEDWPGWTFDPTLPAALVNHWRSAPLARG